MKPTTRILSLILGIMLLFTAAAYADVPDYINVGETPLVDEPVTLRAAVMCHDNTSNPLDTWTYAYITQVMGINLEVEYFYKATRDENVALMMASGNLPDMMISCCFNDLEVAKYGSAEGLLLDMAPYINEENTPNLAWLYGEHPEFLQELTTAEGKVFTLGKPQLFRSESAKGHSAFRMFYNYDLLEAAGVDIPTTLDEFVDMLRAMKEYGEENGIDLVPFGGNYARYNATYLLLNALGYNRSIDAGAQCSHDTDIMLRDGKIVMPAFDREVFPVYLETLHTMYEEGLMEQDYFTLDKDTTKAHLTAGKYVVFSEVPGLYGGFEFGKQWFGGIPLTSEYNDTPFWPNFTGQGIGSFAISAETQYPELCMAFADAFYLFDIDNYIPINEGPSIDRPEIFLGYTTGVYKDESGESTCAEYEANKDKYSAFNYWRYENICFFHPDTFGLSPWVTAPGVEVDENGVEHETLVRTEGDNIWDVAEYRKTAAGVGEQYVGSQVLTWGQYLTDEFVPMVCYFNEDVALRISELKSIINSYANQQIAKFVIGERDLSELDAYFDELEKLGAAEYVEYYADYYEALNNN